MTLTTDSGHEVRAKHAVFATGYELVDLVRPRGHKVLSTWAMATAPQPGRLWPSRCLIWEAADPYLYLRTTATAASSSAARMSRSRTMSGATP